MKYLKAAFVVYSISQTTVDFNGGSIDEINWELIENDCALASIATVATHDCRPCHPERSVAKSNFCEVQRSKRAKAQGEAAAGSIMNFYYLSKTNVTFI